MHARCRHVSGMTAGCPTTSAPVVAAHATSASSPTGRCRTRSEDSAPLHAPESHMATQDKTTAAPAPTPRLNWRSNHATCSGPSRRGSASCTSADRMRTDMSSPASPWPTPARRRRLHRLANVPRSSRACRPWPTSAGPLILRARCAQLCHHAVHPGARPRRVFGREIDQSRFEPGDRMFWGNFIWQEEITR